MTNLLGDSKFLNFMAYGLMLLIGLAIAFWLYRVFFGPRIRGLGGGRSRQPRLGVVDSFDLDAKRQLVLIRRDNTEHLIMIGGPNDVVIESALTRAHPAVRENGMGMQPGVQTGLQPNFPPQVNSGLATAEDALGAYSPNLAVPSTGANARLADVMQDQMPSVPLSPQPPAPSAAPAKVSLPPIKPQPSAIPSAPIPPRMPPMTRPVTTSSSSANSVSSAKPLNPKPLASDSAAASAGAGKAPAASLKPEPRSESQAASAKSSSERPKADAAEEAIDALEQEMARLLNRPRGDKN